MKYTLLLCFFLFLTCAVVAQNNGNSSTWEQAAEQARTNDPDDIQVFPNPAQHHIGITSTRNVKKIVVFNLVGRKMKMFDDIQDDQKYYIGDLPRGMYLVQILGSSNDIITTRRVNKS